MGLDLSAEGDPAGAHWSYGGFMAFRERLAEEAGIPDLRKMEGFCSDDDRVPWSSINSPLVPLLDHSDCEGDLSWQDCATVAPELRRIVESWPRDRYDRQEGIALVELMEHCVTVQVPLEFG